MTSPPCDSSSISLPEYDLQTPSQWTWLDTTIGVTTEEELLTTLGDPTTIYSWPNDSDQPQACIYRYQNVDNYPTFWLAGGKVIGMRFSTYNSKTRINGQPATFNEAKELYGRAEIVGWNPSLGAGYRSIVWLSHGVLGEIYVNGDQQIGTLTYLSPMSEEEFSESFWSSLVLDTNPTLQTDDVDTRPRDPFDWE